MHSGARGGLLPRFWLAGRGGDGGFLIGPTVLGSPWVCTPVAHRSFVHQVGLERTLVADGKPGPARAGRRSNGVGLQPPPTIDTISLTNRNDHHDAGRGLWWSHMRLDCCTKIRSRSRVERLQRRRCSAYPSTAGWTAGFLDGCQLPLGAALGGMASGPFQGGGLRPGALAIPLRLGLCVYARSTWLVNSAPTPSANRNFDSPICHATAGG